MSNNDVTIYNTGVGTIVFMAVAQPFTDKKTGKKQYSIKVRVPDTDPAVKLIAEISPKKLDTKGNRALEGTGEVELNFSTEFRPVVVDVDNEVLDADTTPFFDSRTDEGTAMVEFKVVTYDNGVKLVRLSGVKLIKMELADRTDVDPLEVTAKRLQNLTS